MTLAFDATRIDCADALGGEILQVIFDTAPEDQDEDQRSTTYILIQSQFRVSRFCNNRVAWRAWLRWRRRNCHLNFEKNPHDDSRRSGVGLRGDLSFTRQEIQQIDIFLAEDDRWSHHYCWLISQISQLCIDFDGVMTGNSRPFRDPHDRLLYGK